VRMIGEIANPRLVGLGCLWESEPLIEMPARFQRIWLEEPVSFHTTRLAAEPAMGF
jgi:hypothetical protein